MQYMRFTQCTFDRMEICFKIFCWYYVTCSLFKDAVSGSGYRTHSAIFFSLRHKIFFICREKPTHENVHGVRKQRGSW